MHSPDTSQSKAYIYSNGPTGKIYVDGVGASLMQWAYSNLSHNRAAFVNEGTAEIRGAEAIALYMQIIVYLTIDMQLILKKLLTC